MKNFTIKERIKIYIKKISKKILVFFNKENFYRKYIIYKRLRFN